MDAEASVTILLRNEGGQLYDNILHDVYSGGALPGQLFSKQFFKKVRPSYCAPSHVSERRL
jgi:spermidine synthase